MSRIDLLLPPVAAKAWKHVEACAAEGIAVRVTDSLRTLLEQGVLWDQGRDAPGPIVTHARPGYSWHNFGRAYDVCIVAYRGDQTPGNVYDGPWERVMALAESVGLEAGGRWAQPDRPHFQDRGGLTLAQARAMAGIA